MSAIDDIRPLADQGLTARQIAERVGMTRNAVIGVLYRAGLKAQGTEVACHAWTEERQAQLRALIAEGLSRREIAAQLGTADGAVKAIMYKLGLSLRSNAPRPWTEARIATLRHMRERGATRAAIAHATGMSEEAVKSKIAKLGLKPGGRRPASRPRSAPRQTGYQYPPSPPRAPTRPVCEVPPEGSVSFLDLAPDACRWPYGEAAPFKFCGAPVHHQLHRGKLQQRPYCAGHCAKAGGGYGSGATI